MDYQGLAYASFSIAGDQMNPELWTRFFGLKPDIFVLKGEPFITPAGRTSRYPGRTNVWGVSSKLAVQSDSLEPHLRYLIELLALPRADLREQMDKQQAHMRFFCYWANYTGDRIPDVPDDIRTMMKSMGGTIELDEYR
jgi:hypothetical protein